VDPEFDEFGHIRAGKLISQEGRTYPIRGFIPRFVDSDKYVDSFTTQRKYMMKRFDEWKRDKQSRTSLFTESTGFDLKELASSAHEATFLDVGCGYGRFCETIAETDNEIVGIDMSTTSIELAYKYVGANRNVHLVQCDLNKLPFELESFDYIFSIGVLHHTPDAQASFDRIVPYLKRGGRIAVWVYSPEAKKTDNKIRKITTKIPTGLLFLLCLPMPFVYRFYRYVRRIPEGKYHYGYWPTVMGTFDSWSPKYASVHEPAEVASWFAKNNLCDIQVLERRTAVSGRSPMQ
jgi:ubiquinone/menaquinone biosynthesis C-methylase UbiE